MSLFTLEALEALHGDSLILHYGETDSPKIIVIDGGPPTVYENNLKPRLNQINSRLHPDDALPLEVLMVSHIDQDHVHGVKQLTADLLRQKEKGQEPAFDVLTLWHNSFDDIIGNDEDGLVESMVAAVQAPGGPVTGAEFLKHPDSGLVLASVEEARTLRKNADALDIPVNTGFDKLVMAPKTMKKVLKLGSGLTITVVGPQAQRLAKLQDKWDKEIKNLKSKGKLKPAEANAVAADYVDKTAENLSSIVVLAELGGKKMLLTGDARGDHIQEGLQAAGLLTNGKLHLDLLKVAHHGSIRDFGPDFFENVTADHYVISANGEYGNPDSETLELLSAARGNAEFKLYLTNRTGKKGLGPRLQKFFAAEKAKGKKYKVVFRNDADLSVKADLLEPVDYLTKVTSG